jgi:hypothetical protein
MYTSGTPSPSVHKAILIPSAVDAYRIRGSMTVSLQSIDSSYVA